MAVSTDRSDPERPVLVLSGEIDLACADDVAEAGVALLHHTPGPARIVVDLGAVEFLDSSGLSALLQIRRAAVAQGVEVALRDVTRSVGVLLQLTGVEELFDVDS
jgi:anti-sigma B factor antagonist